MAETGHKYQDLPQLEPEAESLLFETLTPAGRKRSDKTRILKYLGIVFVALLVYTALVVIAIRSIYDTDCLSGPLVPKNILRGIIRYTPQSYVDHDRDDHPFFGKPSEKLDQNWQDLLKWSNIRVPEEEVRRLGRENEGVHFPTGGYYGMMTVHHDLHCLMRFHSPLYLDHYFPNITDEERLLETRHTIHCLDLIQKAIMCQADTTILTMRWVDSGHVPSANYSTPRACIDWTRIQDWARENWVDVKADGMMVHPKYGPVFVNGHSNASRIGVVSPPH